MPGTAITTLGNPDLAWERNKQWDFGLDLAILDSRISFTYDYYRKRSDGLIQQRPIPRASGFTTITSNVGELAFWGHEFGLSANIIDRKLQWDAQFNISFDRNRIISLAAAGLYPQE